MGGGGNVLHRQKQSGRGGIVWLPLMCFNFLVGICISLLSYKS